MQSLLVFDDASGVERSARQIDTNGYMHVSDCPVTKEQVAPYYGYEIPSGDRMGLDPDTIYYVYRPAEELSKEATMASLRGIPLLLDHASVTPEDIRRDRIAGTTGDLVRWDGTYLRCNLNILAKSAQDRVKDKSMRELSLGYSYTPEKKSGEFNGKHYDFVMRDIKANHLALVEVGRAGDDVRVCDSMPNGLTEKTTVDTEKLAALVAQLTELIQPSKPLEPVAPATDEDTTDSDEVMLEADNRDPEQPEGAVTKDTDPTEDEDTVGDEDVTEDSEPTEDEDTVGDEDVTEDEDETKDDDEVLAKACAALGVECTPERIAALRGVFGGMAQDSGRHVRRGMAMDSATFNRKIKDAVKAGEQAALTKMRQLTAAAQKCGPILGRVNPLNFDSAGAIYQAAAIQAGMSAKDARDSKAARGYVLSALKHTSRRPVAMDSAPSDRMARSIINMLDKKGV